MKLIPSIRYVVALALCLPAVCHAALGDSVASVQTDRQKMRAASRGVHSSGMYKVHEMQNETGTVVREYEAPDGTIFAVTWSGPAKPNLKQLFGKYFDRYQVAASTGRAGHRHAGLRDPDLVVQSSGHQRAFSGIAYLPQQVPAGVNVDELQ